MTSDPSILIAGSFGHGNIGDEAILSSVVSYLRRSSPSLHIWGVAGDPENAAMRHSIGSIPWDDWAGLAEFIPSVDAVVLGGGGLFFDYGSFDPALLFRNGAPDLNHFGGFPLLAHLFQKPLAILACGVGPLLASDGRQMTRFAFRSAARSSVRDEDSREALLHLGAGEVVVTADPAFALEPANDDEIDRVLAPAGIHGERPVLAIAPRAWDEFGREWETALAEAIESLAREESVQVLFLSLHPDQDNGPIGRLRRRLHALETRVLGAGLSPEKVAGVIRRCDLVVGMRLHSLVLAIGSETPAIGIAYAPKVRALMRRTKREDLCVELTEPRSFTGAVSRAWRQRHAIRETFSPLSRELRQAAQADIDGIAAFAFSSRGRDPGLGDADRAIFRDFLGRAVRGRLADLGSNERAEAGHHRIAPPETTADTVGD